MWAFLCAGYRLRRYALRVGLCCAYGRRAASLCAKGTYTRGGYKLGDKGDDAMTIPKFPDFLGVVLQSLKDGKEHAIQKGNNSIKDYVIKAFSLTASDLKELVPSGQQTIYYNRISWSITYLRKAGLIENVSRGVLKITDLGVSELRNIDKINIDYLRKFSSFRTFTNRNEAIVGNSLIVSDETEDTDSPEMNLSKADDNILQIIINIVSRIDSGSLSIFRATDELRFSVIVTKYLYSLLTKNEFQINKHNIDEYRPILKLEQKLSNLFVLVRENVIELDQVADRIGLTFREVDATFQVKEYLNRTVSILANDNPVYIYGRIGQEGFDNGLIESISERLKAELSSVWSNLNNDDYEEAYKMFYIALLSKYVLNGSLSLFAAANESHIPWWRYSLFLKNYLNICKLGYIQGTMDVQNNNDGVSYLVNDYMISQMLIKSVKEAIELSGGYST